jgi:hypothetical protein
MPPEFTFQVMIQHTVAKFTTVLIGNSQELLSHSLVKMIEAELDGLKSRFPTPWTPRVEVASQAAKIHTYAVTIVRSQLDSVSYEILLKKGFSVALRIVYLLDQGLSFRPSEYGHLSNDSLQRSLPKTYFRTLILATIFLLRFFVLNINATSEEQEVARNHVAMAQRLLKSRSICPTDEGARSAMLVEKLSRQQPVDVNNAKLRIDNRLGASLVYDAITAGHEMRNEALEIDHEEQAQALADGSSINDNIPAQSKSATRIQEMDIGSIEGLSGPLDFSLPEDLWGDSVWGIFDTFAPMQ